jgi:serine/threonine protein kinase/Tol biopolymer transport system component
VTPERLRAIERLFHEARERTPAARDAFLARACVHDPTLRHEVESLLAQPPAGVIDAPVGALVAGLASPPAPRLAPGSSVGPYRIERLLGVGGMGEVYRARDTTLDRDVAIKILPRHFTADPERLARFEREARLLATLNHPHIAAIYGVVDAEGVRGLILEMVEGPTLADRLATGPLPLGEALRVAHQIAEALEAAHEKGVVHRDLKPANIKITPEGVVKVLDFGLAKAVGADAAGPDVHDLPAVTAAGTRHGVILGTAAYMSPEQARGRPVDKRADIWAFGCVLYEMLTGGNAFDAGTASEAMAKILEREPDWDALPAHAPAAIRRLVQRCLKKDPSDRLHDIADARLEIADALSGPEPLERLVHPPSKASRWPWIVVATAAAAIVAAALLVSDVLTRPSTSTGLLEFPINLVDTAGLGVAVSPNGRQVAFATFTRGGPWMRLHSLDTGVTRAMPGTDGAVGPFWSPDGSAIGFFADGKVKRIDVADGSTAVICDVNGQFGGTWNADGVILFSTSSTLFRVSSAGGTPVPVEIVDDASPQPIRTFPQFLPDGRHFIYHAAGRHGGEVRLASLDLRETRQLVESDYPAAYAAPSYLLFLRGTALVAQPFNPRTLALEGRTSVIASDVAPGMLLGPLGRLAQFSASATGVLAVMKTRGGIATQLRWFDRAGMGSSSIEQPTGVEYLNPAISPDGGRVAVNRMDPVTGNWDVWVVDLARNVSSRLTSDPAQDGDPVWSGDGKEIVFGSNRGGHFGLYRKAVDGSRPEELLATIDDRVTSLTPTDWSPDGRFVVFSLMTATVPHNTTWVLSLAGDRRPFPVLPSGFESHGARFSPDGQWIAYTSRETGDYEVDVQRFMAEGDKKQVSRGGGSHPRWTSDGRELVYWALSGGVASVDLGVSGTSLRVGVPKTLISTPILNLIDGRTHYDVTRDGRRFLLRQPAGPQRPAITVMVNWTEKLKK